MLHQQHPADRLHDQAAANAQRTRKQRERARPGLLSEREQLRRYQERLKQGADGFKDIIEQHQMSGLRHYQNSMARLAKKYGVKLEG